MTDINPKSTAQIAGHPLHPMLIPFPIVFFVTTLVTDLVSRTGRPGFAEASTWLLGAGIVMALVAALAGFTDFFGEPRVRALKQAWMHMVGNLTAVVLEAVNFYLRYASGPGAPVSGVELALSLIVVLLLLFNGWMGWEMVYRHRVGVADER